MILLNHVRDRVPNSEITRIDTKLKIIKSKSKSKRIRIRIRIREQEEKKLE